MVAPYDLAILIQKCIRKFHLFEQLALNLSVLCSKAYQIIYYDISFSDIQNKEHDKADHSSDTYPESCILRRKCDYDGNDR